MKEYGAITMNGQPNSRTKWFTDPEEAIADGHERAERSGKNQQIAYRINGGPHQLTRLACATVKR